MQFKIHKNKTIEKRQCKIDILPLLLCTLEYVFLVFNFKYIEYLRQFRYGFCFTLCFDIFLYFYD